MRWRSIFAGTAVPRRSRHPSPAATLISHGFVLTCGLRGRFSSREAILQLHRRLAAGVVGANVAILAAADPAVRSLALLSPGLDYRSLRTDAALRKYGGRPALLLAGSNDPCALRSAKELAAGGGGIREIRILENAGHGTTMLKGDHDLGGVLVDWFQRTLL
jgi:hypothetical protein